MRNHHRAQQSRREVLTPFDDPDDAPDAGQDPEESALFRARLAVLLVLLDQIDETRRENFVEHHLLDLSVAEIAAKHAIPEETVKTRLKRAWQEIDAARSRWQAEQRRRGGDILPAFLLPMGWTRRGVARVRGVGAKGLRLTASAALVAALIALAASSPPAPPASTLMRWPSAQLVPPTPDRDHEPDASPTEVRSGTPDAAGGTTSRSPSRDVSYSPLEDNLINRARVAIQAGQTGLARRLLADHARLFPLGRRASEREALLQMMR